MQTADMQTVLCILKHVTQICSMNMAYHHTRAFLSQLFLASFLTSLTVYKLPLTSHKNVQQHCVIVTELSFCRLYFIFLDDDKQ